jgi:serine protease
MFNPLFVRLCTLSFAVALALGSQASLANQMPEKGKNPRPAPLVTQPETDQLIIRFRDGSSTANVDKVLTRMKSERGEKFQYTKSTPNHADVFRFSKRKGKADWDKLSSWLKTNPDVEYVEPDYILNRMDVPAPVTPNDPYLFRQWDLLDTTSGINAKQAWGYTTGTGSVVAVVDTGVLPHADLKPNLLPGFDMINDTFVANDGNGRDADATDPGDYVLAGECGNSSAISSSWHGTHVSGTIAAVGNNSQGIAGIAYGAKVIPVRVLGKCGGYTSDVAAGIIWAAGGSVSGVPANPNPARVINMSLGGQSACGQTMQNAINTARSKNAVVVVAAGNSNADASQFSPANCSGVVAVAATGSDGGKAYYSNYGSSVDLAAPGGSMNTGSENGILSTLNTGSKQAVSDTYAYYQGTSMATPHVSGVAALMLSANPALTPDQVESVLKSSARSFPASCSNCGAGLLDATAAVQAALALKPTDPPPVVDPQPPTTDPYADLKAALDSNQALWTSQRISNYSYILEQKNANSTSRLQIMVRRGKVYYAIDLSTNRLLRSRDLSRAKTIDQLFPIIGNAITNKAESIQTTYDSTLGYPGNVAIDPSSSVAGDESSLNVTSFVKM